MDSSLRPAAAALLLALFAPDAPAPAPRRTAVSVILCDSTLIRWVLNFMPEKTMAKKSTTDGEGEDGKIVRAA
jgi:hypothetical protein